MKNSQKISTSEKIFFYIAIGCLIFLPFRIIFTKNFCTIWKTINYCYSCGYDFMYSWIFKKKKKEIVGVLFRAVITKINVVIITSA